MNSKFYNPGMLGDIVYAIPFCLSCAGILNGSQLNSGGKFDYYLDLCLLHKDKGESATFNSLKMLGEVIALQPYIGELHVDLRSPWTKEGALDLGTIRKGRVSMNNGDITRRYRFLRRLPEYFDASTPWLVIDGKEDAKYDFMEGKIAVFRSPRYRNKNISNYKLLNSYSDRIVFFGNDAEYSDFCSSMNMTPLRFKGNFVDICRAFQRCSFVVGNQTFLFSLAEALKVPRLCEMASSIPDVMPLGKMANCFVDEADFGECLKMYANVFGL